MWRYWLIGREAATAREVYAPSLQAAFHLARCNGAGSATLSCFGSRP